MKRGQRIEAYLDRLYCWGLSLANDREDALDLLQDCAVKALSARQVPKDEAAYRAWLFKILRNTFIDGVRRKRGDVEPLDETYMVEHDRFASLESSLINELTVRNALRSLPGVHREVLTLVDVSGFTYSEAADLLEIPVGTVMSRVSRARAKLLTVISDQRPRPVPLRFAGSAN
ncbi:MAG: RNA polymerase sigma factor [Gammaproteobacteria bacterium]|nr:MAG: RNA polymerase sigma factor [Gammaproteobacteria bacterium]